MYEQNYVLLPSHKSVVTLLTRVNCYCFESAHWLRHGDGDDGGDGGGDDHDGGHDGRLHLLLLPRPPPHDLGRRQGPSWEGPAHLDAPGGRSREAELGSNPHLVPLPSRMKKTGLKRPRPPLKERVWQRHRRGRDSLGDRCWGRCKWAGCGREEKRNVRCVKKIIPFLLHE